MFCARGCFFYTEDSLLHRGKPDNFSNYAFKIQSLVTVMPSTSLQSSSSCKVTSGKAVNSGRSALRLII